WLMDTSLIACCLLALLRARQSPDLRVGWTLMALGLASSELGSLVYETGHTGVANVLFLGIYPCQALAMYFLLRGRVRLLDAATVLDGIVCGLGVATLIAV